MVRRPLPHRRTRRPTAFALALLLSGAPLSACAGGGGPGAPSTDRAQVAGQGRAGAAGGADRTGSMGDPLFPELGNRGYEVRHYGLDLDYDVDRGGLEATAEISARAAAGQDLASFRLDLKGLDVRSVRVDGQEARFSRAGDKLTVRPKAAVRQGAAFRTTVRYGGRPGAMEDPDGSVEGWVATEDGAFVVGEPAGAMTWFPCNNHPADKAAYDFRITVPERYTAVANGELRGSGTKGGRTTFRWHSPEPMASYLATATIGRFEVRTRTTANGLPLYVAVDPDEAAGSKEVLGRLEEILKWSAEKFGPYPFSAAGAIVDTPPSTVGYSLETQTKPLYNGAPDVATVVHETAHQWFGDSVTPRTWRDTWLNEGFATYAEWLWAEHEGGKSPQERFEELYRSAQDDALWDFPPGDPGTAKNVTGTPVYERGAMVLQQLRRAVGEKTFFRILKEWPAQHRHANADSQDFIAFCQQRTDVGLKDLFQDWLYGKGRPGWEY